MPMGRYFCNLCNRIVQYGEMDPCFFYKDDDKVYTVPPPSESEATERKDVQIEEIHPAYLNDQNWNPCTAAQQNHTERSNETSSLLLGNEKKISPLPSSRRKRCRFPSLPSTFLSLEKNSHFVSKLVSSPTTESDGNTADARKSKRGRKMESESVEEPQIGHCSTSGMGPSTVAFGPVSDLAAVSVSGPSGNQEQSHKTDRKKPPVCDVCGKAFSCQSHLERHKITHTGEKLLVCGTCGKRFARKDNLSRHLLTHTRPKPFTCEVCGKRFSRKEFLQIHLRRHTGEKPYKWEWCGREFSDPSNYNKHKKNCKERNDVDS